ncbi:MAG: hypothetical protein IKB18_07655 [Tidjanibacter sp.]|nr:hypothetical protein [Tidjanibacter sp.]
MLTFGKTGGGTAGSNSRVYNLGVTESIDHVLCHKHLRALGAMRTFGKSCGGTSRSNVSIGNRGVSGRLYYYVTYSLCRILFAASVTEHGCVILSVCSTGGFHTVHLNRLSPIVSKGIRIVGLVQIIAHRADLLGIALLGTSGSDYLIRIFRSVVGMVAGFINLADPLVGFVVYSQLCIAGIARLNVSSVGVLQPGGIRHYFAIG